MKFWDGEKKCEKSERDREPVLFLCIKKNRKESEVMKKMEQATAQATAIKAVFTAIFAFLSALLGDLAIPVILMVIASVLDYGTGLAASPYRNDGGISSYKSIRGIVKKVCMWLLVVVGAIIDQMLIYTANKIGIPMPFDFLVACIVAIWIICNELISILENIKDMGVNIPTFLAPIVKNIQRQVADKVETKEEEEKNNDQ